MKTLFKNGQVINVFTDEIISANVLVENDKIIGVGDYSENEADVIYDASGKFICPGFIDGHIHIESTMMNPSEFAKTVLPHGTTTVIADPHEIANVCGMAGIEFMLESSENLPLSIYLVLPSCVPATKFDESGAIISAKDLYPLYKNSRVLGLGEMMDYDGVLSQNKNVLKKISDAISFGKVVNGHAPLLTQKNLDKYICVGINDDHECSSFNEALERIIKGQWVMIRQGTAAKNLTDLIDLFDEPYSHRCLLVTDDKHSADLLNNGHIDGIIREAVSFGKSVTAAIRMATIQAAQCFKLNNVGAIAPGYVADLIIFDELERLKICDVFRHGKKVVDNGKIIQFAEPTINPDIKLAVENSFHMKDISQNDFHIEPRSKKCRVIKVIAGQLLTDEWIVDINWDKDNGIDIERDILKLAVMERHNCTGHIGIGFINGIGIKKGAIASSVSHDSHNLIVIGTNDLDMQVAAECVKKMGGGNAVCEGGKIIAKMPLKISGLMSEKSAVGIAKENENVRNAVHSLKPAKGIEPFMNMAFISLPVIPSLKMTTHGLVDTLNQKIVSLYV